MMPWRPDDPLGPAPSACSLYRVMTMTLQGNLDRVPSRPGVYILKGRNGEILYIGKAKVLRNRLRAYAGGSQAHPRIRVLVRQVTQVETVVTDTEVEALILEANLIRLQRPRYNVNLKDDKRYPFIKITVAEAFPRLLVARRRKEDGARYFGPYTNVKAMRATLRTLRKIFPIRTCSYPLPGRRPVSVCLDFHIRRCLGPCENKIDQKGYRQMIEGVCLFLSGEKSRLDDLLRRQMHQAAERENFELAARLRDQLFALQTVMRKQKVVSPDAVDRDILAFVDQGRRACGVILQVREGSVIARQHFHVTMPSPCGPAEAISTLIRRHYGEAEIIPREILLSHRPEDIDLLEQWLGEKRGGRVYLAVPQRGEKVKLVRMALANARHLLQEAAAERNRTRNVPPKSVSALQKELGLEEPPRHIQAFDISAIGGQDAVGSMVVFRDGRASKKEYRRFRIRSVSGQDDFAMMAEVVGRRFRRLLEERRDLPGLVMVDGGKGQLAAAVNVLQELGMTRQPVIGLAKRLEEVFVPGQPQALIIAKSSPALKLLQHIRDEAHRFAVDYHRRLRGRRVRGSELETIPGVGRVRAQRLLRHFGSLRQIRDASPEQLQEVPGLGAELAERIIFSLRAPERKNAQRHRSL
jgi:excinuclease ABC subunit C